MNILGYMPLLGWAWAVVLIAASNFGQATNKRNSSITYSLVIVSIMPIFLMFLDTPFGEMGNFLLYAVVSHMVMFLLYVGFFPKEKNMKRSGYYEGFLFSLILASTLGVLLSLEWLRILGGG